MYNTFFKITLRNLLRHRMISIITILGLTSGISGSIFIWMWVTDELSFDKFHSSGERIYRVEEDQQYDNGPYHVNVTPWPSGPVWKERVPDIENSCRLTYAGTMLFRYSDKVFNERKVMAADTSFFRIFSFQLIRGKPALVLKEPNSIVISVEMARKYFGRTDAAGETMQINNTEVFTITGIMKKFPANSSIDADFIIPFDYMKKSKWYSDDWSSNSIFTYLLLVTGAKPGIVGDKLTAVVKEHNPHTTTKFMLFPLLRIHLHSYGGYGYSSGAWLNVWIFSLVAILVLSIACINFMNLNTARAVTRLKEISLYKINGASRGELTIQFLGESLLYTLISMILSVLLVATLLGPFNLISGKYFTFSSLLSGSFILGLIIITLFTAFLAGSYPALLLSSFKPVDSFRTGMTGGRTGSLFRKASVVMQFTISIALIIFTIVTYNQMKYILGRSLGFEKGNLIFFRLTDKMKDRYQFIKEELLKDPDIQSVTASTNPPHLIGSNGDNIWWEGKSPSMKSLVSMAGIDFDYVETMGITMKSGRPFSKSYTMDTPHDTTGTFLINEQLEKLMGTDDAVGKQLKFGSTRGEIVGVMKDFNFESLHTRIEPLALWMWPAKYLGFIYVRLKPGNLGQEMKGLERAWKNIVPEYPFDFQFLDQEIEKMYTTEEHTGSLLIYFSLLSIMIACIGLYGLATYSVERRRRELGLRKAVGASAFSVIKLISDEFLILLIISVAISVPVSVILLRDYLTKYSYHLNLTAIYFAEGILITIIIALLAISYQLFTAVRINPAESLKHE